MAKIALQQQARELYVFKCFNQKQIAAKLDISPRSVERWKKNASNNNDCWDTARNNNLMVTGGAETSQAILLEFTTFFNATMDEVKNATDISVLDKVNVISSLGDAYTKVVKSAGKANPHQSSLAIALDVMTKFVNYLESCDNTTALEHLVPELQNFGEYYKKTVAKK